MAKNITSVKWTAEELPPGLSINQSTGKISGTPSSEVLAGDEFKPRIIVQTNYGSDAKYMDINFVEPELSLPPSLTSMQTVYLGVQQDFSYTVVGTNVLLSDLITSVKWSLPVHETYGLTTISIDDEGTISGHFLNGHFDNDTQTEKTIPVDVKVTTNFGTASTVVFFVIRREL